MQVVTEIIGGKVEPVKVLGFETVKRVNALLDLEITDKNRSDPAFFSNCVGTAVWTLLNLDQNVPDDVSDESFYQSIVEGNNENFEHIGNYESKQGIGYLKKEILSLVKACDRPLMIGFAHGDNYCHVALPVGVKGGEVYFFDKEGSGKRYGFRLLTLDEIVEKLKVDDFRVDILSVN